MRRFARDTAQPPHGDPPVFIFLDTEFTDPGESAQLISLGLVDETGTRELYLELADWAPAVASQFVLEVVVPLLGKSPKDVYPRDEARRRVIDWLGSLGARAVVVFDHGKDWQMLRHLIGPDQLEAIEARLLNDDQAAFCSALIRKHFDTTLEPRHHALNDAKALRLAYLALGSALS